MHTSGEKIESAFCILHPANAMFWFTVRKCSYFVANTSAQLLLQLVMDVVRVMTYCPFADKWQVVFVDPLPSKMRTEGNFQARFSRRTVWDNLFPMRKKNFLSTGPETTRKRSVGSRASKYPVDGGRFLKNVLIFEKRGGAHQNLSSCVIACPVQ